MERYRIIKLRINCNKTDFKRLQECNKESAMVWNKLLKLNNDNFKINGKLFSKSELRNLAKDIETTIICAMNKKNVSVKLYNAYRAISKARKVGRNDLRYPYKGKMYFETEWDYQFMNVNYEKNEIYLTTSRFIDCKGRKRNGLPIRIYFKKKLPKNIKTLKLICQYGRFYACISYIINIKEKDIINNIASIDLGEIHAITSTTNNADQLIITGRKIRSIKQFRNKKQAELRSKMDKCTKGSRQWNKYRLAYAKIKSKCRRQLDYHVHKLTRLYVNWAKEKGISLVVCGNVTDIEKGSNKGSNVNQKLNQWEYGKIINLLEYKLDAEGIEFFLVPESYTSQICPSCGFKHKPKNRNFNCPNCGDSYHRDIVGAYNILKQNADIPVELPHNNIKYLRIV